MASRPDAAREGIASPRTLPIKTASPTTTAARPLADSSIASTSSAQPHRAGTLRRAQLSWLLIPCFGLVLIAVGWIALLHQLRVDERRITDAAMRNMESVVTAFEQYALRALYEADRTTLLIKDSFERAGHVHLPSMIEKGLIPSEALVQINVTDSAGSVIASTLDYLGTRNMADREYFQLHAAVDTGKFNIGRPIQGRISGKTSIPLSRRLNRADGKFAGIVVLQVNPEYFTAFYREHELGKRGVLAVIGIDGYFRARRSGKGISTPLDAADSSFLFKATSASGGSYETLSRTDSVIRFVGYRTLQDYPLVVTSAVAKDEVLAEFNARESAYLSIGAAASFGIMVFFVLVTMLAMRLQRSHARISETRETLRAAADSSLDAFFLLRAVRDDKGAVIDFTLREVNSRGASLLGTTRQAAIRQRLSSLPMSIPGNDVGKYARVTDAGLPIEEEFQSTAESAARWFQHQVVRVHDGVAVTLRDVTERKRNEGEVQLQKSFLQTLVDNIPLGVLVRRMKGAERGRIVLMNETCAIMDGINAADSIGATITDVLPPATAARIVDLDRQMIAAPMVQEVFDLSIDTLPRGRHTMHLIRAPIFDQDNQVEYIVSILRDITDEQKRMKELRLASQVFETTADAVLLSDAEDRVIAVNKAFTAMTQFAADEVVGRILSESPFRPIDPLESAERKARHRRDGFLCCEITRFRKDGKRLTLWLTASCVYDDAGQIVHFVRVFTDISTLKESEEKLQQLASFDTLTGLPNRRLFHDRLEQSIARASRSNHRMGLLFLDLDGFKEVNDTLGHDVGDRLLQEVTERLHECVRASDSLCRLGGDEFTIIVENATLPDDAIRVAERIVNVLSEPFLLAGHQMHTTASIGVAVFPDDGADSTTLTKNADVAMYRAKKSGRNRYELFSGPSKLPAPPDLRPVLNIETV